MKTIGLIFALIVASTAQTPEKDWWETANFYQIYPRSFIDSNGDGVGDIRGIIDKLEYLNELGVTATWLSPILKSPQVDFGYDVSDFYNVDPLFGNNTILAEMFTRAHELGIKVIMDFVPNHTSNQHQWFIDSENRVGEYTDYYVWHDGKPNPQGGQPLPPNNWQAVFQTIAWTWSEKRQQYYLHQFDKGQPDLNYRNPRVVDSMKAVLTHWLDQGADGFRIDAINHLMEDADFRDEPLTGWTTDETNYGYTYHIYTKDLHETYVKVQEFRKLIDDYNLEHPEESTRVLFTEAYADLQQTQKYYIDEDGNLGSHFPFNFVLIENLNEFSNARDFKREIDYWFTNLPNIGTSNWVLGNHDKPRVGSRYGTDRIDGMLMLLLLLPGVAVTYNGDEIGMVDFRDGISWDETKDPQACNGDPEEYVWRSRDPQRTPFQWDDSANAGFCESCTPWLPVNSNYKTLNLEQQRQAEKSFFKFYQQLSQLRTTDDFKYGHFNSRAFNNDVFGFKRSFNGQASFVLINFSNANYTIDVSELNSGEPLYNDRMTVVLAGSRSSYDVNDEVSTNAFELRSFDAVVLELNASNSVIASFTLLIASLFIKFLL